MKVIIEITSETTDQDLKRISEAVESLIQKTEKIVKQDQKVEEKPTRKKSEKPSSVSETDSVEDVSTGVGEIMDRSSEEITSDTEVTETKVETPIEADGSEKKVTFEEVKKLALEVRQKGVSIADIRGAMERGSEGRASKTLELEPLPMYYASVYAELEKLA